MDSCHIPSSSGCAEQLTDTQTTLKGFVPDACHSFKQTLQQTEEREREKTEADRGNAVNHMGDQIGCKVTTPSMRWFSTKGNGAWGLVSQKAIYS